MSEATDELRERLIAELNGPQHAPLYTHDRNNGECVECPVPLYTLTPEDIADALLSLVAAVVAEARTEGAIAELEAVTEKVKHDSEQAWRDALPYAEDDVIDLLVERAAALRGVGNQKVGVTVDDLALDEMDGDQNAEPRWSANWLEEVLRDGLPDQNAEPNTMTSGPEDGF